MTESSRNTRIGVIEVVVATAFLGLSGPFIRLANLPSGVMTFMRCAIPAVVLGIWLFIRDRRVSRRETRTNGGPTGVSARPGRVGWLLVASAINAVRLLLYFEAYRHTSLGNALLILYSWPAFAVIFGYFMLRETVTAGEILLLVVAFVGMGVVFSGSGFGFRDSDFLGMTLMALSAALFALMLTLIRREKVDRLRATFWQNLIGAFVFLPAFVIAAPEISGTGLAWASANGLFVGAVGYVLVFSAYQRLTGPVVGHLSYLEVVFGLFWAVAAFQEPLSWRLIVGGGLIVVSMMIRGELARRSRKALRV